MKKIKLAYLLLGLGFGIVLVSGLYFLFPEIRYIDLSDEVIIERARDLGYVSLKESLEKEPTEDPELEEEEDEKLEENKDEDMGEKEKSGDILEVEQEKENQNEDSIKIEIKPGEKLSDIAKKLLDSGLISDIEEFKLLAKSKGVERKLSYGVYDFKYNTSYSTIIKLLSK